MPPFRNILEALFDVRPMTKSGLLDLEKIGEVKPVIDLREKIKADKIMVKTVSTKIATNAVTEPIPDSPEVKSTAMPHPRVLARKYLLDEFEKNVSRPADIAIELANIGGRIHGYSPRKSKPKSYYPPNKTLQSFVADNSKRELSEETYRFQSEKKHESEGEIENFWSKPKESPATDYVWPQSRLMVQKNYGFTSPGERELHIWLELFKKNKITAPTVKAKKKPHQSSKSKLIIPALIFAGITLAFYGFEGGVKIKNNILSSGNKAVTNLQYAKENLANFDFLKAADSFALAYDDFDKASQNLGNLGTSFLSSFSSVPGLSSVKSADNLIKAGQHISKAGENLALAFNSLSQTNLLSKQSLSKSISEFKDVLVFADQNINTAQKLLADVDTSILPAEKQQLLIDFKDKIPEFQAYVGNAIDYSDFLLGVIGDRTTKKYLVLMQNNTELRATGGFPGSYAVITFENGSLKDVKVDDVYNIDGQLKENIIPPKPLQHITPNWGMRDANWFADFPTSAKKVEEFYKKDTGGNVDGVMTMIPQIVAKILDVVGPIPMPEYSLTINSENFLQTIQEQVEYGDNRTQPKTIIKDFQPKLFAKLAEQGKGQWLEIFKILTQAAEEKQILSYFNDPKLQKIAVENNLTGQVKETNDDYLQIVLSNVKGSKTDAVIDTSYDLNLGYAENSVNHKLTINRKHNGGSSKYGFYNKVNPDYIRVYVPEGAVLKQINGQSITDYRSLIGHEDYNFKEDPDLAKIEENTTHPFDGVDIFQESGKTVFGFWLVVKPKEQKTVMVNYSVPDNSGDQTDYHLLWQKQSGTSGDPISVTFGVPEGKRITSDLSGLEVSGNEVSIKSDLSLDRELQLKFK